MTTTTTITERVITEGVIIEGEGVGPFRDDDGVMISPMSGPFPTGRSFLVNCPLSVRAERRHHARERHAFELARSVLELHRDTGLII